MARIIIVCGQQGGRPVARASVEGQAKSMTLELLVLSPDIRKALQKQGSINCTGDIDDPASLRVTNSTGGRATGQVQHGGAHGHPPAGQQVLEDYTVVAVQTGGQGVRVEFDKEFGDEHPTRRVKLENLGLSDQVGGAREGAKFKQPQRRWQLASYAPEVAVGLRSSVPDIDDNPYNFVPWGTPHSLAPDPLSARHDRDQPSRRSGTIKIAFTARTPVFIPESLTDQAPPPPNEARRREFFRCINADGVEKYAIPGSSVKGPVRSLFEAVTNSRLGVTDTKALVSPPLYRRRAFRLFRILRLPVGTASGQVQECAFEFLDRTGQVRGRNAGLGIGDPLIDFRANTYWVAPGMHRHNGKVTLRFRATAAIYDLPSPLVTTWRGMFDSNAPHPHIERHHETVKDLKERSSYENPPGRSTEKHWAPTFAAARAAGLTELVAASVAAPDPREFIFAIPVPGRNEISCFGRNVNFLWPGAQSPLAMIRAAGFETRAENAVCLDDADPAEATFGFAGKNDAPTSHPFQGRVRFTMFWGPPVAGTRVEDLRLMPLTAPAGTKAKSRSLYLAPGLGGKAADWDTNAKLRGRKFYWHQRAPEGRTLALQHDADSLPLADGPQPPSNVSQNERLQALPSDTSFAGEVHFDNLTGAELGALLVSLAPHLAFQDAHLTVAAPETLNFGIKVGKGKPRGLGSLVATKVALIVQKDAKDRYSNFSIWTENDEWGTDTEKPATFVDEFCTAPWKALPAVKALENLLKIPTGTSVRVYPPRFDMYGWLPNDNDASGAPRTSRPSALTPAENLTVK